MRSNALVLLALFRFINHNMFFIYFLISYCLLQETELADDEHARENVKELQAAGEDNLDRAELENLISKVYQIQGKHSYILELFEFLYRYSIMIEMLPSAMFPFILGRLLLGPLEWSSML